MAFRASGKKAAKKPQIEKDKKEVKPAEKKDLDQADKLENMVSPPVSIASNDKLASIDDIVGAPQRAADSKDAGKLPTLLENQKKEEKDDIKPVTPEKVTPSQKTSTVPRGSFYKKPRADTRGPRQGRYSHEGKNNYMQDINVPTETVSGMLDIMGEGHGFLRPKFMPSSQDVYISQSQIRRFLLRNGDMVEGQARPPKDNERYWGLLKVEKVNGLDAESLESRVKFEDLVPVYPNKVLKLETKDRPLSTRMIDLVAPIGFGQRGLIVSPPKAGKTTILKEIANGISTNYPGVHLMAALIGERPEEVTDLSRNIKGEVLASNFDQSPQEQTRVAEVALERAKRLVEMGKDVVVLLDSITRLARAYNLVVNPSGRTLSGGFDPAALYPAKKFLGAARCVEPKTEKSSSKVSDKSKIDQKNKIYTEGGSLTVIGTALVETGSRMDDLIYEEFKGTGNMELHLSRKLQERRVFPAIDIEKSGTRHDELLLGEDTMRKIATLRNMLSLLGEEERTVTVVDRLSKSKSNKEFLDSLTQGE